MIVIKFFSVLCFQFQFKSEILFCNWGTFCKILNNLFYFCGDLLGSLGVCVDSILLMFKEIQWIATLLNL